MESCSLNERKFLEQYKESNLEKARNWNALQINRVYPAGRRVDSSNLNPCKPWNMGFQISAVNYQTPDKERDINDGFFSLNGNSGYVMKPDCILGKKAVKSAGSTGQTNSDDDPRSVQIKIISCQWLPKAESSNDIPDPFVKVEIFLANGQVCSDQTKSSQGNGFGPHWEDEDFEFVVDNPFLSIVRFSVWDSNVFTSPKMIGQRSVPFSAISPGYRHIELWSSDGNPLGKGSIFVQVIKEKKEGRRFLCF